MTREQLEAYLHEHIPLSRAMAVRVEAVAPEEVRLAAPLEPNVNHRGTAFGGSIAALAVLAGWGWLRARVDGRRPLPRLVVQRQVIDYLAAAHGDLLATCRAPPPAAWDAFARTLERRGRARLTLAVDVHSGGARAAAFEGMFAAVAEGD